MNQSRSERPAKIVDIQAGEHDEGANRADSTGNIPRTVVACLASLFDTTIGSSGVSVRLSTMNTTSFGKKSSDQKSQGREHHDRDQARVERRIDFRRPGPRGNAQSPDYMPGLCFYR
jgi:hypothetical protein